MVENTTMWVAVAGARVPSGLKAVPHRLRPSEAALPSVVHRTFTTCPCSSRERQGALGSRLQTRSRSTPRSPVELQATCCSHSNLRTCRRFLWPAPRELFHRYGPQESRCTEVLNKRFLFVDGSLCQTACCLLPGSAEGSIAMAATLKVLWLFD